MDAIGPIAVGFLEKPCKIIKADGGGIRFSISINVQANYSHVLYLLLKKFPHEPAFELHLAETSVLIDFFNYSKTTNFKIRNFYHHNTHEFLLTWFNNEICIGKVNEPALFSYSGDIMNGSTIIGFVKFVTCIPDPTFGTTLEWNVECPPIIHMPMKEPKQVHDGGLRWVKMNSEDSPPIDALIGGLEDEPLYIARANHRGSLCPGKYVKSKKHAFIPWGFEEIKKKEFEVLCGYDAIWVKCNGDEIPENAFIGGYSEVHHEALFIGRARVEDHMIVGKVHLLYRKCFLPYRQKEVVMSNYEILVIGNKTSYSENNSQYYIT